MEPSLTAAQYRSVSGQTEGLYKDKGSKFVAYLAPISGVEDATIFLEEVRSMHLKSRHVCYAYRLGKDGVDYRINDDGEPSGSAGRPIYDALRSAELSDVICAVVRYFGGTKLGVPGLIKAYKTSTEEAILLADMIIKTITREIQIKYMIEDMGRVYELIKGLEITPTESLYEPVPTIIAKVPIDRLSDLKRRILAAYHGYGIDDIDDDFESDRISVLIKE